MQYDFAFRPGQLDRAAGLRFTATPRQDERARTYVFWQGKVLLDGGNRPLLAPLDHRGLEDSRESPVFLGLTADGPRFAADLSMWQPHQDTGTVGDFTDPSRQIHPAFAGASFAELRSLMPELSPLDGECLAVGRALHGWHNTHRFCANCGAPSQSGHAGWQRTCPACGTHHFPRTDPVVIMVIARGDKLLLGRGPTWPERMYSLLAGFVEPGETIEAAVRRETFEESGIGVGAVRYVASQPWPFPMSLMFGCHGEALDDTLSIDRAELVDALWVDRGDVRDILAGTHPNIAAPRPGAIASALIARWVDGRLDDPTL